MCKPLSKVIPEAGLKQEMCYIGEDEEGMISKMIISEIYENVAEELFAVVFNEDLNVLKIAKLNDTALTPEFFALARSGFKKYKNYDPNIPRRIVWEQIERGGKLIATITDHNGFIVHDDGQMTKRGRNMFGKKARILYEKRYSGKAATSNRCVSNL